MSDSKTSAPRGSVPGGTGRYSEDVKREAMRRYVRGDMARAICRDLKVSEQSFWRWVRTQGWEALKQQAQRQAEQRVVEQSAKEIAGDRQRLLGVTRWLTSEMIERINRARREPDNADAQAAAPRIENIADFARLVDKWAQLTGNPFAGGPSDGVQSPYQRFLEMVGGQLDEDGDA